MKSMYNIAVQKFYLANDGEVLAGADTTENLTTKPKPLLKLSTIGVKKKLKVNLEETVLIAHYIN